MFGEFADSKNVRSKMPGSLFGEIFRRIFFSRGGDCSVNCWRGVNVRILMQDYKSRRAAVMISGSRVNTQTHTQTDRHRAHPAELTSDAVTTDGTPPVQLRSINK